MTRVAVSLEDAESFIKGGSYGIGSKVYWEHS
jgi:hypothetical protein